MTTVPIRRALVSVSDKRGLAPFATALHEAGVALVSTGSTAAAVREAGVPVTEVAEVTGAAEMLGGRVKTLHPTIHGGILADREEPSHLETLEQRGIEPIDLVVVNLYPFAETVAKPDASPREIVEQIDIGGPTLVRAAAKNHRGVAVVVDPDRYEEVAARIGADGGLDDAARAALAADAFAHTAAYDAQIAAWFARDESLPARMSVPLVRRQVLRYGENSHQQAAWYVPDGPGWGLGAATQSQGKELSYNNLVDADAALAMVADLAEPCVAIIKHTNPAGLAVADTLAVAYERALAGDPTSAFGGIVAANRPIDEATAEQIAGVFTEVVIAPGYSPEAEAVLARKKNLRLLTVATDVRPTGAVLLRSVAGSVLAMQADDLPETPAAWEIPTAAQPDDDTLAELAFAWTVAKHVKSNAIVLTRDRATVGVGAGQMSRVDSVRLAVEKSDGRCDGAVLASDAFFPFRDGPDAAVAAGIRAIIQPGGSVRDDEVVAACDEHGIPMVMTGRRHFRH